MVNTEILSWEEAWRRDRRLQQYHHELFMLKCLEVPKYVVREDGSLSPVYSPKHEYELRRIIELRDQYIKDNYKGLIIDEKDKP